MNSVAVSLFAVYWVLASLGGVKMLEEELTAFPETDKCTALAVGPKAGVDGTMTTHNNDCFNCDWRINKVPAMDWEEGAERPLVLFKDSGYPGFVNSNRGKTWHPDNLEGTPEQIEAWKENVGTTGSIPQVRHTYALIEGAYAIMNEHQVAIGESTCASKLWAAPVTAGGKARIEVGEMTRIGLERGKTAREVIQIMGNLATELGFYAADWSGGDRSKGEGGEGLTVVDKTEAWVFHVTSDDTGTSAVWVAQRVPDDHIAAITNSFVIREVDPYDRHNFMFSDNLWEVAKRTGFWDPKQSPKMDFLKTFGPPRVLAMLSTRRIWRIFQLAAPSIYLPPDTDAFQDDYPFSVKVDKPLSVADVIAISSDHYEGTQYDLTKGIGAGPYGDPNRYGPYLGGGDISFDQIMQGAYPRAISLFRTAYSFVANPRPAVPDALSMMWFGQYAPSSSCFTPLYVNGDELPDAYTRGSFFKYDTSVAFWNFLAVSNYAGRFYKYAMQPVFDLQRSFHSQMVDSLKAFEQQMIAQLDDSHSKSSKGLDADFTAQLTGFMHEQAKQVVTAWRDLLPELIVRFHDGLIVEDFTTRDITFKKMFYPYWWVEASGYFDTKPFTDPNGIAFQPSPDSTSSSSGGNSIGIMLLLVATLIVLALVAYTAVMRKRYGGSILSSLNPAASARIQYEPIDQQL